MERDNPEPVIPDQGIFPDERHDPTHPLVRDRTRSVLETFDVTEDPVAFKSASRMEAGE